MDIQVLKGHLSLIAKAYRGPTLESSLRIQQQRTAVDELAARVQDAASDPTNLTGNELTIDLSHPKTRFIIQVGVESMAEQDNVSLNYLTSEALIIREFAEGIRIKSTELELAIKLLKDDGLPKEVQRLLILVVKVGSIGSQLIGLKEGDKQYEKLNAIADRLENEMQYICNLLDPETLRVIDSH